MFERYTEKARRVIFFARYEASQFGSPYIETEHLLRIVRQESKLANPEIKQNLRSEPVIAEVGGESELQPERIKSYELAARMQMAAPEALDISKESPAVLEMYGIRSNVVSPGLVVTPILPGDSLLFATGARC